MIVACFKGGYIHNDLNPRVQYVYNGPLILLNRVPGKFRRTWALFYFRLFGSQVGAMKFVCLLHRREPHVIRSVICQQLGFHGRIKVCLSKVLCQVDFIHL